MKQVSGTEGIFEELSEWGEQIFFALLVVVGMGLGVYAVWSPSAPVVERPPYVVDANQDAPVRVAESVNNFQRIPS